MANVPELPIHCLDTSLVTQTVKRRSFLCAYPAHHQPETIIIVAIFVFVMTNSFHQQHHYLMLL